MQATSGTVLQSGRGESCGQMGQGYNAGRGELQPRGGGRMLHGEARPCRGVGTAGARRGVVRAGIRARGPLMGATERGQ